MNEKKIVFALIDCSIPINTRNQKIINSLYKSFDNAEIHIITWNREGVEFGKNSYFHAYDKKAAYADVNAKLKGLIGYRRYVGRILKEIAPNVIIASHWSNLMLVSGFKKKNQMLIYENLDIPTGRFPIRQISCFIEKQCLKKVDLIIHASRFFRILYNNQTMPQIILENKPAFLPNMKTSGTGNPLKVAFIGTIRYKEILKNLADALMNNPSFELYFHGSGEDLDTMKQYCKDAYNIYFTGRYDYTNVVSLYHQCDIIWAGYPNKDYNVVYAISNKFHESLYVGVPCVYSEKTKLAEFVKRHNLGFVVDPYCSEAIAKLFAEIQSSKNSIEEVRKSMIEFQGYESTWDQDFSQLVEIISNCYGN